MDSNKKIVFAGDSIMGNVSGGEMSDRLPEKIGRILSIETVNVAMGGNRWADHVNPDRSKLSMYRIAEAVVSGEWSALELAAADLKTAQSWIDFNDEVSSLKNMDWGGVSALVINYGTNDFHGDNSLESFESAILSTILDFRSSHPDLMLITVTPLFSSRDGGSEVDVNSLGLKLTDYVDCVKRVSASQSVQCIDLYADIGINLSNADDYLIDEIHPSGVGTDFIAPWLAERIALLIDSAVVDVPVANLPNRGGSMGLKITPFPTVSGMSRAMTAKANGLMIDVHYIGVGKGIQDIALDDGGRSTVDELASLVAWIPILGCESVGDFQKRFSVNLGGVSDESWQFSECCLADADKNVIAIYSSPDQGILEITPELDVALLAINLVLGVFPAGTINIIHQGVPMDLFFKAEMSSVDFVEFKNGSGGQTNHLLRSTNMGLVTEATNPLATNSFRVVQRYIESMEGYQSVSELSAVAHIAGENEDADDYFAKMLSFGVHSKGKKLFGKIFPRVKRGEAISDDNTQPGDMIPLEIGMGGGVMYIIPPRRGYGGRGNLLFCPAGAADLLEPDLWSAEEAISVGDLRAVSYQYCLALEAVAVEPDGITGLTEPALPPPFYETFVDGGVTWKVVPTLLSRTGGVVKPTAFMDEDGRLGFGTWSPGAGVDSAALIRARGGLEMLGDGLGNTAVLLKVLMKKASVSFHNVLAGATKEADIFIEGVSFGDELHVTAPPTAMLNGVVYDAYTLDVPPTEPGGPVTANVRLRVLNVSNDTVNVGPDNLFKITARNYE